MAESQRVGSGGMDLVVKWLLWQPDWEKESYPEINDLILMPIFAIIFPLVRYLLDSFMFERLGKRFISGFACSSKKGLSEVEKDGNYKRLAKFKESAWKFVYYLTAETLALTITYNEPWFKDTKQFWIGPDQQCWPDQKAKLKLKLLYTFAGGFYTYSIFALLFWETRRKDFGVSMAHHVATLALILISYMCRFSRAGSMVLALHDASDVFLEIGKLTKYCGSEIVPSISFLIFALSWLILRLIYFPFFIIWSTSYEVLLLLDREKTPEGPWLYYILNTLLISLLVLHMYWWILIYRMIVRQVEARGKMSHDVRSDSEDEDKVE
ncbi:hypothetical protein CY35_20G009500 [Sphagnum magellanicum]|nr:hypothetical protein CY35_20G009500 [Sphagnum magellanicum]